MWITAFSDAILPTIEVFKWSVEDFLGCRLVIRHDGFTTGGATADTFGAATSFAASLDFTVRYTSIDSNCALGRLELASGVLIWRNGLRLLK